MLFVHCVQSAQHSKLMYNVQFDMYYAFMPAIDNNVRSVAKFHLKWKWLPT